MNPGEPLSPRTKRAAKAAAIYGEQGTQRSSFSPQHQALAQQHQPGASFANALRFGLPHLGQFCKEASSPGGCLLIDLPVSSIASVLDGSGRNEGASFSSDLADALHERAGRKQPCLGEFLLACPSPGLGKDGIADQVDHSVGPVDWSHRITGLPSASLYSRWEVVCRGLANQRNDPIP